MRTVPRLSTKPGQAHLGRIPPADRASFAWRLPRSVGHEAPGVGEFPRLIHPRQSVARRELHDAPVFAEQQTLEFSGSIDLNYAVIGGDGREFTPAVSELAPAPGAFCKCSPCGGVSRPGCMFFAASFVVEALLHLGGGLHTSVTPGAIECAA